MSIDHNNLRRLDLNLLLAFDALMRTQSVSAAADRLSLGQPAMSHSLRRLRDLFGDDLLVREGGRLNPTDRGLDLWSPVRAALEGLEPGLDMARGIDPNVSERVFRISLPDYLGANALSHLLARSETAPGVQFRIESLDRGPGFDALISGELDAFVGVMPASDLLIDEPLLEDDFVTLFDPEIWQDPPISIDAFTAAQQLLVAQFDSFEGWGDVAVAGQGRARHVGASVARFGDAVATLKGTPLLVTLPRLAAKSASSAFDLASCQPAVGARTFTVNLYRRRRASGAPASEWLATQLRDSFDRP